MKLKTKFLIWMSVLFVIFATAIGLYSQTLLRHINEKWGERFVKKQIIFDKYRTLLPIMREVSLVKEMANDPEVIEMALHEDDPNVLDQGIKTLETYRLRFQDRSYFAAFTKSGHYYFNDSLNAFKDKQLRYTLNPNKTDDRWFFEILREKNPYVINVNKDSELGTTKVWIDFLLKKGDKTIGIIGTGLDLTQFLKESVDIKQEGIRNILINKDLAIQLERDTKLIDYASLTKKHEEHTSIKLLLKDNDDQQKIQNAINELSVSTEPDKVKTLWVNFEGKEQLVGIAYLKELGWFSITVVDSNELILMKNLHILPILTFIFIILFVTIAVLLNTLFLNPINRIKQYITLAQKTDYDTLIPIVGTGEIAQLSQQLQEMVKLVYEHQSDLEEKVKTRTRELKQNEQKLNIILESVEAYIYIKDTDYNYIYANKYVRELFHKSENEIIGKNDNAFFNAKTAERIHNNDKKVIENGERVIEEEVSTTPDGNLTKAFLTVKIPMYDESGKVYALCGISTDITERKIAEEMIKNLAFHDTLTNLPNRRMLDDRLSVMMANAKRTQKFGALIFLDLDNFKTLNDTYGHKAGDMLLIEAAKRFLSCVREGDTVARLGGDEFIIALGALDQNEATAKEESYAIAQKILAAASSPYLINLPKDDGTLKTIHHHCTASIGITLFKNEKEKDNILLRADQAMYKVKESGRNGIRIG